MTLLASIFVCSFLLLAAGAHAQNFTVIKLDNPIPTTTGRTADYTMSYLQPSRFTGMVAMCGGDSYEGSAAAFVDTTSNKNATWVDLSTCGWYNGACQFEFGDDGTLDVPAVFSPQCATLTAYSIADGSILWQTPKSYTASGWTPLYHKGYLYYFTWYANGMSHGDLVCVDAATGTQLWTIPGMNGRQSPFLAGDDTLIFALKGGGTGGFSLSQNKTVWNRTDITPIFNSGRMDAHMSMFFGEHLYLRASSGSDNSDQKQSLHKMKPASGVDVWSQNNLVAPTPFPNCDACFFPQVTFAVQTYEVFVYNGSNIVDIGSDGTIDFVTKGDPKYGMGILAGKKTSAGCLFSVNPGAALNYNALAAYAMADGSFIAEVKLPGNAIVASAQQQKLERAVFAVGGGGVNTVVTMELDECPSPSSRVQL